VPGPLPVLATFDTPVGPDLRGGGIQPGGALGDGSPPGLWINPPLLMDLEWRRMGGMWKPTRAKAQVTRVILNRKVEGVNGKGVEGK